ncbi:hypothetical protein C8J57DRAFT_1246530 [Mycena rebaudengoi]|nr:hypothetical protein C8J57DRAFT_1246530 [Mycena rebaudengoi]
MENLRTRETAGDQPVLQQGTRTIDGNGSSEALAGVSGLTNGASGYDHSLAKTLQLQVTVTYCTFFRQSPLPAIGRPSHPAHPLASFGPAPTRREGAAISKAIYLVENDLLIRELAQNFWAPRENRAFNTYDGRLIPSGRTLPFLPNQTLRHLDTDSSPSNNDGVPMLQAPVVRRQVSSEWGHYLCDEHAEGRSYAMSRWVQQMAGRRRSSRSLSLDRSRDSRAALARPRSLSSDRRLPDREDSNHDASDYHSTESRPALEARSQGGSPMRNISEGGIGVRTTLKKNKSQRARSPDPVRDYVPETSASFDKTFLLWANRVSEEQPMRALPDNAEWNPLLPERGLLGFSKPEAHVRMRIYANCYESVGGSIGEVLKLAIRFRISFYLMIKLEYIVG